ncbi:aspartate--tRNA ligase [Glaciimonas immobilis]|uniref:Aspartate--tRNA(Asp/Asn) ligase n=1 Tax=Glaciimonas immobilis TaxID=728004 RepID=A0A840RNE9_9BURK|nr:aspartate--tRNA ligase [Glaciimonas immobilis]KAF3997029.1 aspartate--tRNA ligase [Glaciimonas immobilis]MBB5199867.1 aspartyl-tRNA synthetase [Glaciimonas immobilis]
MHQFRTHNCAELTKLDVDKFIRISGWLHRKRDHGQVVFLDIRDNFGIIQCVLNRGDCSFELAQGLSLESVCCISGIVVDRDASAMNLTLPTGAIEIKISEIQILSKSDSLPFSVNSASEPSEELRLKYRFLDLRREHVRKNILLRGEVIASLRRRMSEIGFIEFQTPILTASSPEGARDFLVPSRLHPGKFYALPQAPQQFKQLLMIAGFDKYFQIAPCFRDEASRADRSPGEFYQLDLEMSFVTEQDILSVVEPVISGIYQEFSKGKMVSPFPFRRISYDDSVLRYGSDKPDLRNPLIIEDQTVFFLRNDIAFPLFREKIAQGEVVRSIKVAGLGDMGRRWFDVLNDWVVTAGGGGLAYVLMTNDSLKGPLSKFISKTAFADLAIETGTAEGVGIFFLCGPIGDISKISGSLRTKIAEDLNLITGTSFEFCWITDFPMYELDDDGKIDFCHNPFSMPKGGMKALLDEDPLKIKASQFDLVCNGIELSSGAIRNHLPDIMYKAFEIAGYAQEELEAKFGGMLSALKFGAPPHGGCAPGVDRIIMQLADEPNIREVICFPLNQQGQDLMMNAPNEVDPTRLRELKLKLG